jgi:hypothetical protein
MIRQFAYVDWRARDEGEYQRLLKVCRVEDHHDERWADSETSSFSLRSAAPQVLPGTKARQSGRSYFARPFNIAILVNVFITLSIGVFLWSRNQPQPNVPVIEIVSTERFSPRSASQAVNAIHVAKSTRKVILLLAVDEELLGFAAYRFILTSRGGKKIWDSQELSPDIGGGYFSVEFPRSYLAAGAYQGRLYGLNSGRESLIASYPLEVSRQ